MKAPSIFSVFFIVGTLTLVQCKTLGNSTAPKETNTVQNRANETITSPDTIVWNEHIHDFQTVPSGPPASTKYTFINKTPQKIKIDKVEVGCSCTASDYSKSEILPNDTGWISASYKTANTFGYFRKHVDVFFTNGKKTHLILTGTVDPMIPAGK